MKFLISVTLSWSSASDNGVAHYRVVANTGGRWTSEAASITINELQPDTDYTFSVYATDGADNESLAALVATLRTYAAGSLSTNDVFIGMSATCNGCHGPSSSTPYFGSLEDFERLVVAEQEMITPGDPDGSLFIRVLEGNGDAPWGSMPLGSMTFSDLSARGQTGVTVEAVRYWVETMEGN